MADEWGDFEAAESPAPAAAPFSKGDAILYKTRDGTWVPGKLVSIDLTIQPPSFCIEVDGSLRETEEWRLRRPEAGGAAAALSHTPALLPAQPPAAPVAPHRFSMDVAAAVDDDDDDFGDFSAAGELAAEPTAPAPVPAPPAAAAAAPDPLSAAFGSPQGSPRSPSSARAAPPAGPRGALSPAEGSFRRFLAAAAPDAATRLDQEDSRGSIEDGGAAAPAAAAAAGGLPHGFGSTTFLAEAAENGGSVPQEDGWFDDFGDFEAAAAEPPVALPAVPPAEPPDAGAAENGGFHDVEPALPQAAPPPPSALLRMLRPASPTKAPPPPAGAPGAVQEYGVAWSMMLTAAADRLEAGRAAWSAAAAVAPPGADADASEAVDVRPQLLGVPRAHAYFAALGRVFFAAGAVRLAADALGLLRFVPEMGGAWGRCQAAWGDAEAGDGALGWAAGEAAARLGLPLAAELAALDAAAAALPGMTLDEFPRMLAWSEGLDALTLLPLALFGGEGGGAAAAVPRVAWSGGREALAPVANFWLGCVSAVVPELE